jgi:hypothetical protein
MLVVHRSDRFLDPIVELYQSGVFWVGRLVNGVVTCYPGVIFIMLNCRTDKQLPREET